MNTRVVLSFFAGMAVALAVLLYVGLFAPYASAQVATGNADAESGTGRASVRDLVNVLRRVRPEIQCEDTALFYDKLIAGYGLPEAGEEGWLGEGTDGQLVIPSIIQIQHTALTLPFTEAGKNIRDEGLQDFYYTFLQDAGLISPAGGGTG